MYDEDWGKKFGASLLSQSIHEQSRVTVSVVMGFRRSPARKNAVRAVRQVSPTCHQRDVATGGEASKSPEPRSLEASKAINGSVWKGKDNA
jgi:hypothetical protein